MLAQVPSPIPTGRAAQSSDVDLVALLPWLAIPVVLILVIVWRWRAGRRRGAVVTAPDAVCGKCGYGVAGLPTFTCPECGSDLRTVGIARRGGGKIKSGLLARLAPPETLATIPWLIGWTIVYAALYACVGTGSYPHHPWDSGNRPAIYGVVDGYLWPYRGKSLHTVTLEPRSDAYRRVVITEQREASFRGWRSAPQLRWTGDTTTAGLTGFTISLELDTLTGKAATMEVNPNDLTWRGTSPADPTQTIAGAGPLDADALWSWMVGNGVDQPSPVIKDEAASLVDLIKQSTSSGIIGGTPSAVGRLERIAARQRDAATGPMSEYPFKSARGTAVDVYGPAWSIYWLSIPFGLGVYTYGTNWIFGRAKRKTSSGTGRVIEAGAADSAGMANVPPEG
jgi:hypothetical protein